jgi:hypothetical protein
MLRRGLIRGAAVAAAGAGALMFGAHQVTIGGVAVQEAPAVAPAVAPSRQGLLFSPLDSVKSALLGNPDLPPLAAEYDCAWLPFTTRALTVAQFGFLSHVPGGGW